METRVQNRVQKFHIKYLGRGEHFGTLSFFVCRPRNISVRCVEFTSFLIIRRSDFLELLSSYPSDYERFCMITDEILLARKYDAIGEECRSCGSYRHQIASCPYLHVRKEPQRLVKIFNKAS